jgi:zona occludens toxin
MLYVITGLPGGGKTLNTFKEIIANKANFKRPLFYYNIPCNLLDFEYCKTFQAYFYSVYLLELEPDEKKFIQKRVDLIETKYRRLVELQDFPYLEVAYKEEHDPFTLWFSVVNRVSSSHQKTLIASVTKDATDYEQPLTFELFEKYNFHWSKVEDVQKWHLLEPTSIFVCDEAQEYFPVRIKEKPPEFITAFERHRHSAFDVYLVSQSANFIDVHVRRLAGTHVHFYRPFNSKTTSRLEWSKVHNPDDYHDKQSAQKSRVKNDKRFFGVYRSAVSHTHKFKLPKIFLLLPLALVALSYSAYSLYSLFTKDSTTIETITTQTPPIQKGVALNGVVTHNNIPILNPYDLPIYKTLRKPTQYPELSCYKSVVTSSYVVCSCYTQQATKYKIDKKLCVDFVDNGFFDYSLTQQNNHQQSNNQNLESGGVF